MFAEEDGTLTTWSNMVRQQRGGVVMAGDSGETRGRTRTKDKEENNINNNMDSSRKSRWARTENSGSKSNSCREKETWWCLYNFWLTGNGFNVALLFMFSSRTVKSSPEMSWWGQTNFGPKLSATFRQELYPISTLQNTKQPLWWFSVTFPTQSRCFQESAQHRQGQARDQARVEGGGRGRGEVPEGDHGRGAEPDQALPRPAGRQKQLEWN